MSRESAFEQRAPGDQLDGVASFASELERSKIWRGREVTASFSSSATTVVRHGMQRRYRGAFVVGVSTGTVQPVPYTPSRTEAAGYDPATWLYLEAPSSITADFVLWVF